MKRGRGARDAVVSHSDIRRMSEAAQIPLGRLIRHSGLELMLTAVLLFGVTTIVRFAVGPSILSRTIPRIHLQLLIVGAIVAVLLSGLIISRPGKISGGHMNPAISLAMWRFGVFPATGVVPYITAQLLGSVIGVLAARAAWGAVVEQPPVLYALIRPAPRWSTAPLFAAELVGMGVIVFAVGYCLSNPRLARAVPWLVGILVGLGIALLGTQTGGSLNPARQFGPAVISGHTAELWVFLVAPMVGAEIAARLLQAFQKRGQVLTHRLCGTHPDGRPLDDRRRESSPVVNPAI
jgi:glycerol uptake facilitator-like aquaporin